MRRYLFVTVLCCALATHMAAASAFDHSRWNDLLNRHVLVIRDGSATQVNYAGLQQDRSALKAYLSATSAVAPRTFDAWSRNEQMAFLINAYNAWTVELILTRYPKLDSIKDLGSFVQSPWKKRFIPLLGATRSLDDIEHGGLRDPNRYRDPRVHFAVNCASIGCPALRNEAYVAEKLDAQLDDAMRRFLSDRTRNRYAAERFEVSSIFNWYRDDFERGWRGYQSLSQFLAANAASFGLAAAEMTKARGAAIVFLDYDWRLNDVAQ